VRALILEPNIINQNYLRSQTENAGYVVDVCSSINEAWLFMTSNKPDVMIMTMAPVDKKGIQAIRRWRKMGQTVKILVISNEENLQHKVNALNCGADDYIVKPFRIEELIVRLQTLIRRTCLAPTKKMTAGNFELNIESRALFIADEKIKLTNYEFEIMMLLIKKCGKLISKYEIMRHLHDDIFNQSNNTVEVIIGRLRKKIAPYKCGKIENKRGDGYYLDAETIFDHKV
jgi:two-component system response regulator PhoP